VSVSAPSSLTTINGTEEYFVRISNRYVHIWHICHSSPLPPPLFIPLFSVCALHHTATISCAIHSC
jgi:hypothetical protein